VNSVNWTATAISLSLSAKADGIHNGTLSAEEYANIKIATP
jgi:hypothetical protein